MRGSQRAERLPPAFRRGVQLGSRRHGGLDQRDAQARHRLAIRRERDAAHEPRYRESDEDDPKDAEQGRGSARRRQPAEFHGYSV